MRSVLNIIAEDTPKLCKAFAKFAGSLDENDRQEFLAIWNGGFGENEKAFNFIKKNPTLIKDALNNYGIYNTDIERMSLAVYYAPTVGFSHTGRWEVIKTIPHDDGTVGTFRSVFATREEALAFVAKNMLYREVNWL